MILQRYIVGMSELEGCTTREFVADRVTRPGSDEIFSGLSIAAWGVSL